MQFHEHKIVSVENLIPYALNSRTHSDAQVAQLAASIREFGFTNPVLVDDANNLIAGHGRLLAARKLKMDQVPAIVVTGLDDRKRRALLINDNKLALNAGWDEDALRVELEDLAGDFGELMGFSQEELVAFFVKETTSPVAIADEDCVAYNVVEGDVFKIGRHIMACGDTSDPNVVSSVLCGDVPDVVFYDPPFEIQECWGWIYPAARAVVFSDYRTSRNALDAGSGFLHCYHFVWDGVTSWYTPNRPLARHKSAFVFSNDPFWDFDAAVFYDGKTRTAKTVSNTRGASEYVPLAGGMVHLQTVFQFPNTQVDDGGHAHAKPGEWIRALMLGCGAKIVLDQFAGSGSFAVAAPDWVSVRGIEKDPTTCGRAITRISAATGVEPVRI